MEESRVTSGSFAEHDGGAHAQRQLSETQRSESWRWMLWWDQR